MGRCWLSAQFHALNEQSPHIWACTTTVATGQTIIAFSLIDWPIHVLGALLLLTSRKALTVPYGGIRYDRLEEDNDDNEEENKCKRHARRDIQTARDSKKAEGQRNFCCVASLLFRPDTFSINQTNELQTWTWLSRRVTTKMVMITTPAVTVCTCTDIEKFTMSIPNRMITTTTKRRAGSETISLPKEMVET